MVVGVVGALGRGVVAGSVEGVVAGRADGWVAEVVERGVVGGRVEV